MSLIFNRRGLLASAGAGLATGLSFPFGRSLAAPITDRKLKVAQGCASDGAL